MTAVRQESTPPLSMDPTAVAAREAIAAASAAYEESQAAFSPVVARQAQQIRLNMVAAGVVDIQVERAAEEGLTMGQEPEGEES